MKVVKNGGEDQNLDVWTRAGGGACTSPKYMHNYRNSQNPGDPEKGERSSLFGYWLGPPLIRPPPCKNLSGLSLLRAPPPRCGRLQARRRTAAAPNHLSGLGGVSYRFLGGFPIRYVSCCIIMYLACIPHVSCRIHVSWVYLDVSQMYLKCSLTFQENTCILIFYMYFTRIPNESKIHSGYT